MTSYDRLLITTFSSVAGAVNDPSISGTASNCLYNPKIPLSFKQGTKFAVESISMSLSYGNITSSNQYFGYKTSATGDTVWVDIEIGGNYGVSDLNSILQQTMFLNGDYDDSNPDSPQYYISMALQATTGQVQVVISNNYALDLSSGSLYANLGFSSAQVITTQGLTLAPNKCAINTVNSLLLYSDLTKQTLNGSVTCGIIAVMNPTVAPWNQLIFTPSEKTWQTLNSNPIMSCIFTLFDQTGTNNLNLNGQPMTISIVFEEPLISPLLELNRTLLNFYNDFKKLFKKNQ